MAQSSTSASATKGTDYYENLCMRAVNQSIGKTIYSRPHLKTNQGSKKDVLFDTSKTIQ